MAEEKHLCHCGRIGGHLFITLGIFAIVYGITRYLMVVLEWPTYTAWLLGGIILIVVGYSKKWWA